MTWISVWLSLTWSVEGIAGPVVVVSLIKGQPDVCGTFGGLLEHQARHVAPQLEGGAHRQPHGAQRQVARPVHYLVGQMTFVPLLSWRTPTDMQRGRGREIWHTQVWSSRSRSSLPAQPMQLQIRSKHQITTSGYSNPTREHKWFCIWGNYYIFPCSAATPYRRRWVTYKTTAGRSLCKKYGIYWEKC